MDLGAAAKLEMDLLEKGRIDRDFFGRGWKWQCESEEEQRELGRACRAKDEGREL